MNNLLENDTRKPIGHLNYIGNVVESIKKDAEESKQFGPNYMGEIMFPVTAEYDEAENKTKVGFSLMAPPVGVK